jgi:ubiquinone/menaquinone biosynthesis C-methylase UbiE
MLAVAREQAPAAELVQGDALDLGFPDGAFDRVFTGHFYGHLDSGDRERFLEEARRVASELVVVDSITRADEDSEQVQERFLNDGTRWTVYKRYFEPGELAEELGGGEVLLANRWFVMIRAVVS